MAVLMMIAACYGVWQLTMLGSATRSVRVSMTLLALVAGLYGSGMAALGLQLAYTRGLAAITDTPLHEVVATASYTVDPLIEELAKVAPFVLLALLSRRIRGQWGLTDFLLLGAAGGAGFALVEVLMRHSNEAAGVLGGGPVEGWTLMKGFSFLHIPGLSGIISSWLPTSVSAQDAFSAGAPGPDVNLHLVWSALAGLGAGLLLRAGLRGRLAGAGLILFAWVDHAAYNRAIVAPDEPGLIATASGPLALLRNVVWLYPILALAAATYLDRQAIRAGKQAWPDTLTAGEQAGQPAALALGRYGLAGLPWTPLIAWRFTLTRRSALFARALRPDGEAELHRVLTDTRADLDASSTAAAWHGLTWPRNQLTLPRTLKAYWPLIVWAVLLLPVLLYYVAGTFPATQPVQTFLASPVVFLLVLIIAALGLLWMAWQVTAAIRGLPAALEAPVADTAARTGLRAATGIGAVTAGAASIYLWLSGTGPGQPVLQAHILDALGKMLMLAALLLALAALFTFPPIGLLAGGGLALTPAAGAFAAHLAAAAAVGAYGALLSQAANNNSGGSRSSGGSGRGSSSSGSSPEADGIKLDSTGKVHGELPNRVPETWKRPEIEELAEDLRTSIENRKLEQLRLGEHGPHRARIAEEEQLLRQIAKILSGS